MTTVTNILAQIKNLPLEDQRMLNKLLVAEINQRLKEEARESAVAFRVGDTIKFDAKAKGGMTTIQITGFTRDLSRIKGVQIGGQRAGLQWTIPATVAMKV